MVGWLARATRVYLPPHVIKQGDVLTTGGRMTKQCFFIEDGPSQRRLMYVVFFRSRFAKHDKGTVTFTIKGGDIKICVLVSTVAPDKEGREGWIELTLLDEKATLGNKWLKCVYDTTTRKGLIEATITAAESQEATH